MTKKVCIDNMIKRLDVREKVREMKDLGRRHGPAFLAYAIAVELMEDVVAPAVLIAVGRPELAPVALAVHTEPVAYPLYFAIRALVKRI